MAKGGNIPCVMNAANEVAVASFLAGELGFLQIAEVIETTMDKIRFIEAPTLSDYQNNDLEARSLAEEAVRGQKFVTSHAGKGV